MTKFTNLSIALVFNFCFMLIFSQHLYAAKPKPTTKKQLPQTVAEKSNYRATSRHRDVQQFIKQLAISSNLVNLQNAGKTVEGRPLTVAIVANPPISSPKQLANDQRLVVLLLGNIHSGECAGKEALLRLMRQLASNPKHPLLKNLVILFLPNYNADGNERIGKLHRPGQIGPEAGMGIRENAQGLDLNRDFVKLESPESRSLVRLINRWNPHLFIDTHTTNGSKHRYPLTYDIPHNPATDKQLRRFMRQTMMPVVTKQLSKQGLDTFYYGNFNKDHSRWTTYGHEPRYSTEYVGMRGRLAILSEAYSYVSYKKRIEATHQFVSQCLRFAGSRRQPIRKLLDQVAQRTIHRGKQIKVGDKTALGAKVQPFTKRVTVKGYKNDKKSDGKQDYQAIYFGNFVADRQVQRCYAYLLPYDKSRVADRLRMHGIRIQQLKKEVQLEVEIYKIIKISRAAKSFQGHRLVTAKVSMTRKKRLIPAGTYVIPTAQPLGTLATYLLEPTSDDGLVTWNFFDDSLQKDQEFSVMRIAAETKLSTKTVRRIVSAEKLTMQKIYGPKHRVPFSGSFPFSARWLDDGAIYTKQTGSRTRYLAAETGAEVDSAKLGPTISTTTLRDALRKLPGISAKAAEKLSKGRHKTILTKAGLVALIRHQGDLFYYFQTSKTSAAAIRLTNSTETKSSATLSPNAKAVAFIKNHNLHVVGVQPVFEDSKDAGSARKFQLTATKPIALTTAGSKDLFFGELDWVYQEELYGRGDFKGFWWSPDSSKIALLRFDEKPVKDYTVTDHIPYRGKLEVTRYPKSGDPLPNVSLGVVGAFGGKVKWIEHYQYTNKDHLISRVDWSTDSKQVIYQVQNRAQTWLDLRSADPISGKSKKLFRETTPAWVSRGSSPVWLKNMSFLWLSQRSGYRHIYHVSADGKTIRPITSGPWEVIKGKLHGIDKDQQWIYFDATKYSATEVHTYRIKLDGSDMMRITKIGGNHSVRFNKNFTHLIDYSSHVHQPTAVNIYRTNGTFCHTYTPNLVDHLKYYQINPPQFHKVIARDGVKLDAMLIKPANFDPQKKYPVLIYNYSGPQLPTVRNRWGGSGYLWHQMLAQKGYCIWMCDTRSATYRGAKYAWPIHRQMGVKELEDIEDGLKWLKKKPWIDGSRIGIWGWSYGGYMTAYALTHSKSFKVGISGAPVTDWRNYDAVYTERYMGLPQDNPEGYKKSSVVAAAAQLHGRLLLLHGTIDDNVHLSNTLQLVHALQKAGKQFDLMIYPKNRHGVSNPSQSRQMKKLMLDFILKNL